MSNIYDLIIKNGNCFINNNLTQTDIGIKNNQIIRIGSIDDSANKVLDAKGLTIIPGAIDTQVHFREPGNPDKEDLESGSKAAILGGITSIFEMPNTNPTTDNLERFQEKLDRAKNRMYCNYAFYFGATENNFELIKQTSNLEGCCGIKMFVGSSTGTLLVKKDEAIEEVIRISPRIVSIHSEDDDLLQKKKILIKKRIHILHVSCKEEIDFLANNKKYVTVETTPQFLTLFAPDCYEELGTLAQMNPPIRTKDHQVVLWKRLLDGTIDVLGSDHAPHTLKEKQKSYPDSPSGLTGVQTMLPIMLDHVNNKKLTFQRLVELLSINPCKIFNIKKRGEIKEGYYADLTIIDMNLTFKITNDWIASRCGWTPFNNKTVKGFPVGTIVNGKVASWDKKIVDTKFGKPLEF
ncbi:MAG: dihydroorotase [Candidatus Fonsibacter lacus]|nr:dihydroorotase [Candidatus Fonsibacter lacus]